MVGFIEKLLAVGSSSNQMVDSRRAPRRLTHLPYPFFFISGWHNDNDYHFLKMYVNCFRHYVRRLMIIIRLIKYCVMFPIIKSGILILSFFPIQIDLRN